jgi:hypothetical protein
MKLSIILIALVISISGCATKPVKYDVAGIESSAALAVADLRPAKEKEQEIFSVLISSDAYAIYRNGETIIDPTPLRLFQHRAYEKFSANKAPTEIKIYHMVSYMNAQSELKKVAVGSIFGPAGALVASSTQKNQLDPSVSLVDRSVFESLTDKEYQRAFYTAQENPNKATVFVIYIDAEINGKRVFIRKTSPRIQNGNANPYVEAVDTTIKAYLSYYDTL